MLFFKVGIDLKRRNKDFKYDPRIIYVYKVDEGQEIKGLSVVSINSPYESMRKVYVYLISNNGHVSCFSIEKEITPNTLCTADF